MTDLERAALAVCKSDANYGPQPGNHCGDRCKHVENGAECPYEGDARAAIEAVLLNPSEEVVEAAARGQWVETTTQADDIGMPYPPDLFESMHPDDKPRMLRIARAALIAAGMSILGKME
jgi:hypothetical protein